MTRELGYATRLAEALWEKYWKTDAPDWKPLPDLIGVLTQIDNMTIGLARWPSSLADAREQIIALRAEIERLTERGMEAEAWCNQLNVEIERLRNTLQLHAEDCQSLNGEVTMFKERAEAAEAEIERLQEHVATLQALRELDRVMIAELRAVLEPRP